MAEVFCIPTVEAPIHFRPQQGLGHLGKGVGHSGTLRFAGSKPFSQLLSRDSGAVRLSSLSQRSVMKLSRLSTTAI